MDIRRKVILPVLMNICAATAGGVLTYSYLESRRKNINNQNPQLPADGAAPVMSNLPVVSKNLPPIPVPVPQSSILQNLQSHPVVKAGLPSYDNLIARESYIASYDKRMRTPSWVAEVITKDTLKGSSSREKVTFKEDPSVHPFFRSTNNDYSKSGYDRGHMVPAGNNKSTPQAMEDTFYLSNICPQVGEGFNRDYWSRFEEFCRQLTRQYDKVYIVTGPLWLPKQDQKDGKFYVKYEVIGSPPNVSVPTHFYKVIMVEKDTNQRYVAAFVMPNEAIDATKPLMNFQVNVEHLEKYSGLFFFRNVDKSPELCLNTRCELPNSEFWKKKKEPKQIESKL